MSKIRFALTAVSVFSLTAAAAFAQPQNGSSNRRSGSAQPPAGRPPTQQNLQQGNQNNPQSAGQRGFGRTNQGNAANRRQQTNQSASGGRTTGRNGDPRRQFTENAMRFDLNSDQQLAAHELRNLFVVLVSQMQAQQQQVFNPSNNNRNTGVPQNSGLAANPAAAGNTGGTVGGGTNGVSQNAAIQQAIFIFLRLVMQFDSNGDGLLSQAELNRFAQALLENDMNLAGAAAQRRSGGRSNSGAVGGNSQLTGQQNQPLQSRGQFGSGLIQQQQQQQSVSVFQVQQGQNRRGQGSRGTNRQNGGRPRTQPDGRRQQQPQQ